MIEILVLTFLARVNCYLITLVSSQWLYHRTGQVWELHTCAVSLE